MHDAITIGDYCYRNKHEPMLFMLWIDDTFATLILKSISYESIDTYFMLPDIGTGIYYY